MDFMKKLDKVTSKVGAAAKGLSRVGKQSEVYLITFKPLVMKLNVQMQSTYYIVFQRGPQKDISQKYELEPQNNGLGMQTLEFKDDVFSRSSKFYKQKDGKFEDKSAEITVYCSNSLKADDKQGYVKFSVNNYIGRGPVKDSLQFQKSNVQYLDFEITVEHNTSGVAVTEADDSDDDSTRASVAQLLLDGDRRQTVGDKLLVHAGMAAVDHIANRLNKEDNSAQNTEALQKLMSDLQTLQGLNNNLQDQLTESLRKNEYLEQQMKQKNEAEERWKRRCAELEKEVEKLKMDNEKFYSVDKFEGYNEF